MPVDSLRVFLAYVLRCGDGARQAKEANVDGSVKREPVDRDLRRRQLAQRLVAHQARTQTIFRLTGLSRHQLATLRQRWQIANEMRHRGPPPTSFAVFRSTVRVRAEAAALAVFWRVLATASAPNGRTFDTTSMVEYGERLCEVVEAFLACFPRAELDLEHLLLLARGIEEADAIALSDCGKCGAVILADLLGIRRRLCSHCQHTADAVVLLHADPNGDSGTSSSSPRTGDGIQQELF